jgi:hypothetical protein
MENNRFATKARTVQARTVRGKTEFLEQIKRTPVIQLACEKVGIGRATVYRWRETDKAFAAAMDQALKEGQKLVSEIAESQLMAAIKERNMTAIIFWLKHHDPSYMTKVEINANIKEIHELTPEQREVIRQALRLAALPKAEDAPLPIIPPEHEERKTE